MRRGLQTVGLCRLSDDGAGDADRHGRGGRAPAVKPCLSSGDAGSGYRLRTRCGCARKRSGWPKACWCNRGLSRHSLAAVVSIDLKADEAAVHAVAAHFSACRRASSRQRRWRRKHRDSPILPTSSLPKSAATALPKARRWRSPGPQATLVVAEAEIEACDGRNRPGDPSDHRTCGPKPRQAFRRRHRAGIGWLALPEVSAMIARGDRSRRLFALP